MTRTIDTRFFIRHFTADTEDLKIRAGRRMRELREESAIIPTIVIHELYKHQCESLGKETAETRTTLIMKSGFRIVRPRPRSREESRRTAMQTPEVANGRCDNRRDRYPRQIH